MSNVQRSAVENDGLIYLDAWAARRGSRAEQSLLAAAEAADYLGRILLEKADYLEAGALRATGKM